MKIILVGSPNSGKTTLFNWLTGSKYRAVNYPGSTVEIATGNLKNSSFVATDRASGKSVTDEEIVVMDTPGIYSLSPKSYDEQITFDVIKKNDKDALFAIVVDGTQLIRHLLLVKQAESLGLNFVVILTMRDLVKASSFDIDIKLTSSVLGKKVYFINGNNSDGIFQSVQGETSLVEGLIENLKTISNKNSEGAETNKKFDHFITNWNDSKRTHAQVEIKELLSRIILKRGGDSFSESQSTNKTVSQNKSKTNHTSNKTLKIDSLFLHPLFGPIFFLIIMTALFSSIFWLAKPAMELVSASFALFGNWVKAVTPGSIGNFLAEGVIGGVGAVFVFVPQIFILFLGVGFLEGSGYLARAAALIDRPLHFLGMSGRSFVPILSGFACAVPAMMASRNLNSKRDRWITNFIIPLLTCSARLPVFALLLSIIFFEKPTWQAGLALAVIYFLSFIIGAIAAGFLNKVLKKEASSIFMMELPVYRMPRPKVLVVQALHRTRSYVRRAGFVIFALSVMIWVGIHFPQQPEGTPENIQIEKSYLGTFGKTIEPIFVPMGVDWRVGIGLLTAFTAREVFVSNIAILFSATETAPDVKNEGSSAAAPVGASAASLSVAAPSAAAASATDPAKADEGKSAEDKKADNLLKALSEAKKSDGQPLFTFASMIGLIAFFMIALQCISTVAISARENDSWKFAATQLVTFNVVAYIVAVVLYQTLK